MRPRITLLAVSVLLDVSLLSASDQQPEPQQWGTVKGRVVWAEKAIPVNLPAVGAPRNLGILQDKIVVHPQNRGVRWVLVWLADPKDARNARFLPPIHPSFEKPPPAAFVAMRGMGFEPRVTGLWVKRNMTVQNPQAPADTFVLSSIATGPKARVLIPPRGQTTVRGFVPKLIPTLFSCNIRRWMKGYVGTFAHPYFAVTDADGNFEIRNAPAGKFQLLLWQEEVGFLTMTSKMLRGKVIEIKGGGVTDVGKVGMKAVE